VTARETLARAAAVICWVYAAGFGLSAIPVGVFLLREHRLPWLWDLFPMYGGPWSSGGMTESAFVATLGGFLALLVVVAVGAWLLWTGRRSGAVVVLATIPVEAIFWWGFALPIPPVMALARVILVIIAWPGLRGGSASVVGPA
jgi:hypothetical protein